MDRDAFEGVRAAFAAGKRGVSIVLVEARGSTPREAGATMVVLDDGRRFGTIGGGQLEWRALGRARAMIENDEPTAAFEVALGPETGQCCGGRARVRIERLDAARLEALEKTTPPRVPALIFGSGPVGRALARALAPLNFAIELIDPRADELALAQGVSPHVRPIESERILPWIEAAPAGYVALIATHDHGLDFAALEAALRDGRSSYLGLIGSKTKRRRFENGLRDLGLDPTPLVCPIGASAPDKRPATIAVFTAAQILTALADRRGGSSGRTLEGHSSSSQRAK